MYIIKNAFRNIMRTKGRNVLIGIIIAVIACSCCIGLSIREAATDAKESTLDNLTIEAEISVDRNAMMGNMQSDEGKFDKSQFTGFDSVSLSLDEMLTYAELDTVSDFYYTMSSSLSSDTLEPIATNNRSEAPDESESEEFSEFDSNESQGMDRPDDMGGGMGGGKENPMFGTNGDFSITGYSSEAAMADFKSGNSYINVEDYEDSVMFDEGTSEYQCIITDELATYNDIAVGDEIVLYNPNDEEETYTLTVVGVYTNTQSTAGMGMRMQSDPANNIYMSYEALAAMVASSSETASTSTNQFGMTISNAITGDVSGTYVFDSIEDYEKFSEDVYDAGLSEEFQVSSTDVQDYEQSLQPLETLSKTAGYFLVVILAIGALVLIVLNMFSIRERKYEVGVLTAIGMKKGKVATQFLTEILIVTLLAVVIGGIGGGIASVPVADALLENQVNAAAEQEADVEMSFGRGDGMTGKGQGEMSMPGGDMAGQDMGGQDMGGGKMPGGITEKFEDVPVVGATIDYVNDITAAVNVRVLLQLFGICILLALVSGAASVITIMRYEPLKILSNRD